MSEMISKELKHSNLYGEDLAPVPVSKRSWNKWNLAAIWVGMAVCIPTYLLASYMIRAGLSWQASLIIIGLANLVITIPMAINGHAGVKYGIPFPVLGRAGFGTRGVHVASLLRAFVACGWFGIQTWIGGLAIYSIITTIFSIEPSAGLDWLKFVSFGIFWLINIYFIFKGTEGIRWLEDLTAPILLLIGGGLIFWAYHSVGSVKDVLNQSKQLQQSTLVLKKEVDGKGLIQLNPLTDETGKIKAQMVQFAQQNTPDTWTQWIEIKPENNQITLESLFPNETNKLLTGSEKLNARFKNEEVVSGIVSFGLTTGASAGKIWEYILWFTAMVGFWATMAISISDITRFAVSQKAQVSGQFIGLPGTMIFYSFVGIFVTSASIVIFKDVLIAEDAPWDPVSLVAKFKNPAVIILAQIAMLLATLSTNIAANVIAPANAFSNLIPQKISFKYGGLITGLFGILICPWWLMDEISSILIFVSGLLGPVLAILICDYFLIRKTNLSVSHLYDPNGEYAYGGSGINSKAILALLAGILAAVAGLWIPALSFLYSLSWFTGFAVSFLLYYLLMAKSIPKNLPAPQ